MDSDIGLKILYPLDDDSPTRTKFDIVAVHGLQEHPDMTWTYPSQLQSNTSTLKKPPKGPVQALKEELASPPSPTSDGASIKGNPIGLPTNKPEVPESLRNQQMRADSLQGSTTEGAQDTQAKPQVKWLQDEKLLPSAFPEARILRFGYGYKADRSTTTSEIRRMAAEKLIDGLSDIRKTDCAFPPRPIIFIGHAFGGLVIASALDIASGYITKMAKEAIDNFRDSNSGDGYSVYKDIMTSTVGVMFLSTPFRPSNDILERWKALGVRLSEEHESRLAAANGNQVSASPKAPNSQTLGPNRRLIWLADVENLRLVCFYENQSSGSSTKTQVWIHSGSFEAFIDSIIGFTRHDLEHATRFSEIRPRCITYRYMQIR